MKGNLIFFEKIGGWLFLFETEVIKIIRKVSRLVEIEVKNVRFSEGC